MTFADGEFLSQQRLDGLGAHASPKHHRVAAIFRQGGRRCRLVDGLALLVPHRRVEKLIVAELPGLQARLRPAVAEVERILSYLGALDELRQPDWQACMDLRTIGASIYGKIVRGAKAELPSVRGEDFSFAVVAEPLPWSDILRVCLILIR